MFYVQLIVLFWFLFYVAAILIFNCLHLYVFPNNIYHKTTKKSTCTPTSEISPKSKRGQPGLLCSLGLYIGPILGSILGSHQVLGSKTNWPWAFLTCSMPLVPMFWISFYLPDTPPFYATMKHHSNMNKSIEFYQGESKDEEINGILADAGLTQNDSDFNKEM